ncbi:MAG: methyltransferase domain-containing protein [Candidatus Tectomicrobia bacterium]|uniref:Methyltransferase domain-containing protein n=1 Tax=Tectimicrobiota bacterium TaxID=2528274 RepID=A0A937W064_UNCTE|nr:methyltransferase domain-containing protein [Candidatus Tectomicrobia bacterium]
MKTQIAIVGGGLGGLMTAYHLQAKCEDVCDITILEASPRFGGKIVTKRFDAAPVLYEAGVAELYDYSMIGPDPLRELVAALGLETVPMDGQTVVLGEHILRDRDDIRRLCGAQTLKAIDTFRALATHMLTPEQYYEGASRDDNEHPWSRITGQRLLDQHVQDSTARKYFRVAAHSDIATELHLTNGLNSLKNFLMDVDGYIRLYSIVGGIEQLPQALIARLQQPPAPDTPPVVFRSDSPVVQVGSTPGGRYRLTVQQHGHSTVSEYDIVILALPHNWLTTLAWDDETLARAMVKHIAHYDRPAHYLRVSLLFQTRFWREHITDSWFMSDAFNGCCVYDESARHDAEGYGVLGWLLAGSDAMSMNNLDDQTLIQRALDSLPAPLQAGRHLLIEGHVTRWLGAVNGLPGGLPVQSMKAAHVPTPEEHPGLFVVGDYLFDATLNGVLDSADVVSDLVLSRLLTVHYQPALVRSSAAPLRKAPRSGLVPKVDRQYFDTYRGLGPYADTYQRFFSAAYLLDVIRLVWGAEPGYRLLDAGSASGLTLEDCAAFGVQAWGVENNHYIYASTPDRLRQYNVFGNVQHLPFPDNHFDFVYETCLCHLPERRVERAIRELHRVTKRGIIFGSITSDMNIEIIRKYDLLRGVRTLATLWEWSEMLLEDDCDLAITEPQVLEQVWQRTIQAGKGPGAWYDDPESLRYSFYTKLHA